MQFIQKYRLLIAGAVVIIVGVVLLMLGWQAVHPLPETTEFKTRYFSFTYPRVYDAHEYAPGVVSIRNKNGDQTDPLIEVTRYQSDPDAPLPKNFDTFMKLQAGALCGADGPVESITCTQVGVTPYKSPLGFEGQQLNLTLVRKNLKTGTTTDETYGPLYVFNTTYPQVATPDQPLRYTAIFVTPSLAAFLNGTPSSELMQKILSSLTLTTPTTVTTTN